MKTQCPHCHTLQAVPNEYANKPVKCTKCSKSFSAVISVPILTNPNPKPYPPPDPNEQRVLGDLHAGEFAMGFLYLVAILCILGSIAAAVESDDGQLFLLGLCASLPLFAMATIIRILRAILHRLYIISKNSPNP